MAGGVGRVDRVVAVGQDGAVALAVGDVGRVAVGVVVVGGRHQRRLGDPGDLEVGVPGERRPLVLGVLDLGDLAVGVVGVGGRPRQRRGHRGLAVGEVVGEPGLLAGPVGAGLELPAEPGAVAWAVVGEGRLLAGAVGLHAAGVADAVQAGRLAGGLGVGVDPVGRRRDGRPGARRGGVGEHEAAVGQEVPVGLGPAPLGDAQQVAVVVVPEVQRVAGVVGDALDLAAHLRLLGVGPGVVDDREVAAAGVGHGGDVLLGAAGVVGRVHVAEGEGEGVVVAVGDRGRVALGVVVEGDLVGPGQRPLAGRVGRAGGPQVQVDPGRLLPAGGAVGLGGAVEAVDGAVAVGELDPLVGVAGDLVGLVGVDVQAEPQAGQAGDGQREVVAGRRLGVVFQRVVGQVQHS